MYTLHPSKKLVEIFSKKPYQGINPKEASFLFVGLDANYGKDIESQPIFDELLEYHEDGVSFWISRGVHHPFLLPDYRGDGKCYHKNFSKIGFGPEHASNVSFVELLAVPTTGRNKVDINDIDPKHIDKLKTWVFSGNAEHIFPFRGNSQAPRKNYAISRVSWKKSRRKK